MKRHTKKLLWGIIALIVLTEAIGTGLLPVSRGYLFDILELRTGPVYFAIFIYFINYLVLDFIQSVKSYAVLKISLLYRTLKVNILQSLFRKHDILATNVPQRVQEDVKLMYVSQITVYVEYAISAIILIQLIILNWHQPILIAFALIYAVISIFIAARFNPRLTRAEILSQQSEASYRTSLVESIHNHTLLAPTNTAVLRAAWMRTEYLLFTRLQLGLLNVLPYLVLVPQYLDHKLTLGQVVEHQSVFALIVVNAAVIIQLYTTWIQGKASALRVDNIFRGDNHE